MPKRACGRTNSELQGERHDELGCRPAFLRVLSTQHLPHMGRDLAPGRKPDIVAAAGLGGDCLERPGACWPPVDMGMGGDVAASHHQEFESAQSLSGGGGGEVGRPPPGSPVTLRLTRAICEAVRRGARADARGRRRSRDARIMTRTMHAWRKANAYVRSGQHDRAIYWLSRTRQSSMPVHPADPASKM